MHFQIFPNSRKSLEIGIYEVPLIPYFVSRHSMFVEERGGTHFMIKLQVFMKKKCSYLNNNFLSVQVLKILFPSLKGGKYCKTFLASRLPQICNIFSILPNMQHFPNHWSTQIFLTSGIGPDILMKVFEGYIILLFRQAGFCLIFIFSKNKGFRSFDLLK